VVAAAVKRARTIALLALAALVAVGALVALSLSVENSAQFQRLQPLVLVASAVAVLVLAVLIARKVVQLVAARRRGDPGSRLTARTAAVSGALVALPLVTVYLFSLGFLNRGIDSWFNVEMRQSLDDAVLLSRSAIETRMREHLAATEIIAEDLAAAGGEPSGRLEGLRRQSGAIEIVVATESGAILAVSKGLSSEVVPDEVPGEVLLQVRQGRPFVSLEPQAGGGYLVRTAVPLGGNVQGRGGQVVQAIYPVAERIGALADTLQAAYQQFGEKDYLRKPLKASFILTLTVVLLLSLLAAWYGAIFTAQRLVQPIQDLVKGTRAVAQGDLDMRLPLTSHDEMGFLVHSFNDMTKRLRRAREDQQRAQQAAEQERGVRAPASDHRRKPRRLREEAGRRAGPHP